MIEEFKNMKINRHCKKLSKRHIDEMQLLEENYLRNLNDFEEFWKNAKLEHREKCRQEEEQLLNNHHLEMTNTQKNLEEYFNKKVMKYSVEYLDLKKKELVMKKQERYLEAQQIKEICINLQKKEIEEFHKKNSESMKNKMIQLIRKLNLEMDTLRQKFQTEVDIMNKEKEKSLEILIQKYKNKKCDLSSKQANEKYLNDSTQINKLCIFIANIVLTQKVRNKSYKILSYSQMENKLKEISNSIRRK